VVDAEPFLDCSQTLIGGAAATIDQHPHVLRTHIEQDSGPRTGEVVETHKAWERSGRAIWRSDVSRLGIAPFDHEAPHRVTLLAGTALDLRPWARSPRKRGYFAQR